MNTAITRSPADHYIAALTASADSTVVLLQPSIEES